MTAAIPLPTLVVAVGFPLLVVTLLAIAGTLYFKPRLWIVLLALFFGLLAGFIDLLADEPQLPAFWLGHSSSRSPGRATHGAGRCSSECGCLSVDSFHPPFEEKNRFPLSDCSLLFWR